MVSAFFVFTNENKMKKTILFILCLLTSLANYAYDFEQDGIYYNINPDGKTVSVTYREKSAESYSGDVFITQMVEYDGKYYRVTNIGEGAFEGCTSLISVSFSNGTLISIGNGAFRGCNRLQFVDDKHVPPFPVNPPAVVGIIDDIYDEKSDSIDKQNSISIDSNPTCIGDSAFWGCHSLKFIDIPNSVKSVGNAAFEGCNLTAVVIPESVTSIGKGAFSCQNLTSVNCLAKKVPTADPEAFESLTVTSDGILTGARGNSLASVTLYVPKSALKAYKSSEPWSLFGKIKPLR